jgi:beta-phosphoglucomutase
MLQAVFFDFDGVIADSEPLHLRAYQAVLRREGIELSREDYYQRYLGYDDVGLFQALATDRGISIDTARINEWIESKTAALEQMLIAGLKASPTAVSGTKASLTDVGPGFSPAHSVLFPGAADCIRRCAAQVPLAIASGALEPEIAFVLEQSGLRDCFKVIASASDGVRGKPAPDLYMLAMAKLRDVITVQAGSCVAIEDSHWGLEAARQAGLRTVAVTHTYPAEELRADLTVAQLGEITIPRLQQVVR